MRDKSFDSQVFCSQLKRICETVSKDSEVLSRITPRPWGSFENSYRFNLHRATDLIRIAILSWFVPEEWGILLRMSLEEEIKSKVNLDVVEYLLQSKTLMILFLQETTLWNSRDFFGNILRKEELYRTMSGVSCRYETTRAPKRPQRIRGYRDKGTLKLPHQVHEISDLTREQNELEESRIDRHNTFLLSLGFLGLSGG